MFDLSASLMSSLETSRSRGPHENCITQQKRGGRKITVWTRNWLVRRAKRPWRLATKSSGDIQLSPKATPAHIQQIVFLMSRCSKIQIRENTTSKLKLQFPGLNGFDDGQGDGDRVLPSVRLCYDEEWAVPPWLVLTVELLQKRSQVDRCLHISPHEEALVLHVAESCSHRVVLHFSFGGRIKWFEGTATQLSSSDRGLTTKRRSAFCSHVDFRGFKSASSGPISWKFPIPTPEAPFHHENMNQNSDVVSGLWIVRVKGDSQARPAATAPSAMEWSHSRSSAGSGSATRTGELLRLQDNNKSIT